ncbi:hypothetical protein DFH07DRAFT_870440 [Mycena maculata]|uniref:NADH:flavin oxidoreductase/NADH oxidase N-terminal domain-containing protein n=1 Tax=Mycena maculata TaxID=230809 RepID=A0AAD7IBG0_9AGAR|nr:hypothetical protein DFH07DRAFT_870440 [Mycena maculata]
MSPPTTKLFEPLKVGTLTLQHRIVLAPMTRLKADDAHVPIIPLVSDFYGQRASKPGSLLVTESTLIAARAGGVSHEPGIWSADQIKAWKALQSEDPSFPYVSASGVQLKGRDTAPRPLTVPEIQEYVQLYVQAAKNAIEAGFDGVEFHNANGYLPDQFLHEHVNRRTDEYGGSIENCARFTLEMINAIVAAIGVERTAVRFSPWSPFQEMTWTDPIPTFSYVIAQLAARHPRLAYLHLIEPRINGDSREEIEATGGGAHESNDALAALWAPRPLIRAGGFTRAGALKAAERGELVAFGRFFISNPDFPTRLERDIPLNPYNRSTFYLEGVDSPLGYTDQPFAVAA